MLVSSVRLRLCQFSQSSFMLYIRLCVLSSPISVMMIVRIPLLDLVIIIKSEVWPNYHCLGLGHETIVCAVKRLQQSLKHAYTSRDVICRLSFITDTFIKFQLPWRCQIQRRRWRRRTRWFEWTGRVRSGLYPGTPKPQCCQSTRHSTHHHGHRYLQ